MLGVAEGGSRLDPGPERGPAMKREGDIIQADYDGIDQPQAVAKLVEVKGGKKKEPATRFGEYRRKKRRQRPVTVASLRLFLRSSTGPNRRFQCQSLGRVRDPVRIAEGPTAINAATQRRHFGFRLRLVDNLQPIGG